MKKFHLGQTIVVGRYRITVIEERSVVGSGAGTMSWFFAESRPCALVVASETAVRCIDLAGEPLDLPTMVERATP